MQTQTLIKRTLMFMATIFGETEFNRIGNKMYIVKMAMLLNLFIWIYKSTPQSTNNKYHHTFPMIYKSNNNM